MTDPMQHEDEQSTDLTAESLIEEVSIDGMCGVY
ncbi:mycofactocin precursor MftA [Nocardioides insulae]|nr:mycofactocin precursor MftA [Nocardioides insulae]